MSPESKSKLRCDAWPFPARRLLQTRDRFREPHQSSVVNKLPANAAHCSSMKSLYKGAARMGPTLECGGWVRGFPHSSVPTRALCIGILGLRPIYMPIFCPRQPESDPPAVFDLFKL